MIVEVGNTKFKLTFSFVAVIVLMLLLCDEKIVVMSVISSVVHESGHLIFMLLSGDRPKNVELSIFGMRIDRISHSVLSYKSEMLIALGGIIFNLLFAAISFLAYSINKSTGWLMLLIVNLMIALINGIPVRILDMGRAVKFFLLGFFDENKTEAILDKISYICVILFLLFSLGYSYFIGINISLIAVTVYLYAVTIIKKWS